jgi:hypothetical protein
MIDAALFLLLSAAAPELGDFQQRCEAEGKRLWGRSLCAPVVVVNAATGAFTTSKPPPSQPLPAMRANTAIKWGGEDWIMVLAPLPSDPEKKASMLFHEAWHVHQQALGFPSNNAVAPHLGAAADRYLMRLEWAALAAALKSTGKAQPEHVAQALAFRKRRIGASSEKAEAERAQMQHEGLAAYTGAVLSGAPVKLALEELEGGARRSALTRSFAYVNGPAWGLLLDRYKPGWRQQREKRDLADMAPIAPAEVARADAYGGTALLAEEMLAGFERDRKLSAALAATAESKALRLPLKKMSMDFDPNRITSAPDGSSIYEKITLSDGWGRIRLDGIPLRISSDFTAAYAPWPLPSGALEMAEGWRLEEQPGGGARLVPPTN